MSLFFCYILFEIGILDKSGRFSNSPPTGDSSPKLCVECTKCQFILSTQ